MPYMSKLPLQQRIKEGQQRHERDMLSRVRRANRAGALWTTGIGFGFSSDWKAKYNALDRLVKKGKIEHVPPQERASGTLRHGGYRLVGFRLADATSKYRGREWKECDAWGRPPSDTYFGR